MRVALDYNDDNGNLLGSRFFLQYAGAAPTAGNCITIAGDIEAAWLAHLAPLINEAYAIAEVDVLDIATYTGASGQWTGNVNGTESSAQIPANVAVNIEYSIARRYRGGKPRMFMPAPGQAALNDVANWTTDYKDSVNTGVAAFFTAVEAIAVGAVGALTHVNLSYYQGFKNITNSSGRERAVPTYRDTALIDTITAYSCKALVGSQRRRRSSTTY